MIQPKFSMQCVKLIKKYEGFKSTPYICAGNKKTIGYGTTVYDEKYNSLGINSSDAEKLLIKDLNEIFRQVSAVIEIRLNKNQIDAICSLVYNIGIGNFRDSTLLKLINENKLLDCPQEFVKWRIAQGKILRGLIKRRLEEALIFVS